MSSKFSKTIRPTRRQEKKISLPKSKVLSARTLAPQLEVKASVDAKESSAAMVAGESSLASSDNSSSGSISRALVDPQMSYFFRLQDYGQLTASATGTMIGYITWNPSTFDGFTELTDLFSEIRIRSSRLSLCWANPHSDGYATGRINGAIAVSYDLGLTAATPATVDAILSCQDADVVCSGSTSVWKRDARVPVMEFARTSSTVPGPYAGCYGQWQFYNIPTLTASTLYGHYYIENVYEFRTRS
jgi:hypothetical protein